MNVMNMYAVIKMVLDNNFVIVVFVVSIEATVFRWRCPVLLGSSAECERNM